MVKIVVELAYNQSKAMMFCKSYGREFIKHFHKIYTDPKNLAVNHWMSEMQTWLNEVLSIKLKRDNKPLRIMELNDWFFTAGADPKDYMKNPSPSRNELDCYDKFVQMLLQDNSVRKAFESLDSLQSQNRHIKVRVVDKK